MDFGDLENDKTIQEKLLSFQNSVTKIEEKLKTLLDNEAYEKLSLEDKVHYDIFTAYTLNTLFWLYLRTKGVDPNTNDVKNELNRIRQYMIKAKQAHDRNTIRPTVDKDAAGRFIKHGIQYRKEKQGDNEPPLKKQKITVEETVILVD